MINRDSSDSVRSTDVTGPPSPQLSAAYRACARMQRRHDPTYYWATRRLPRDVRPAVHALYGFVRGADEIVDGPRRPSTPDARRTALDAWEGELERGLASGRSSHPVIAALVDAGRRHDLPLDELKIYMGSMRVDCGPVRIASQDELERYMRGSAGAVGRIMAPLLGASPEEAETFGRLGVAFQLTNFIRDVREDWSLDRVYLPGLAEDELRRGQVTPALRERVAEEVGRARALFADTREAVDAVLPRVRPGMRLARAVYVRVLDRVEAIGFDVLGRRADLAPWEAAPAAARGLMGAGG
jgi:15-cis-phytoene synthase